MQVRHQSVNRDVTVEAYPVIEEQDGEEQTYYFLRAYAGRGKGGVNEPAVHARFTARQLRDFAVDLLSLVAVEESRV